MKRRMVLSLAVCLAFFIAGIDARADSAEQPSYLSVRVSPTLAFPILDSAGYYGFIGGGTVSMEARLPFFPS